MHQPNFRLGHIVLIIAFLLTACGGSGVDQSALQTAAVGTLNAEVAAAQENIALQTAEAENTALQATVDALAAENEQLMQQGTATAVAAATLAQTEPQLVAPDGAICRVGPDASFGAEATLEADQPYPVFARATNGEWWQVASPEGGSDTCWVFWDEDLTFLGDVFNLPLLAGPAMPATPQEPTHAPGISARFVQTLTCRGVRMAMIRVQNLGPETYQSAIVRVSDSADNELHRSDGNNEFLPNANTCPGGQPTLGPGEEKFVAISVQSAPSGDTLTARVTVCTEKGYGGNCWGNTVRFIP